MGKTVLFVSHDLSSVSKYCDRVVLLNKGVKMAEGNPKEMIDLYKKVLVNQADESSLVQAEKGIDQQTVTSWKDALVLNPNVSAYGDQKAEIIDFGIMDEEGLLTNNIVKGKNFFIKMKVRFYQEVNNPIFAFTIRDLKGTDIAGTNTMFEKVFIDHVNAGEEKEISFLSTDGFAGAKIIYFL